MSSQPETTAEKPSDPPTTTSTDTSTTETLQTTTAQTNKPIKKVKSKKDLKDDPSRFESPGINFSGKLIGIDDVDAARGDKMCQDSMARLKMAVKQSGQHKQKIIINVSLDGIRIMDLRTQATNHTHPVHRISFISRDITDARAFGYVFGAGEGKHKFFAIKTEKASEALVLSLRDLFQAVYEKKKQQVEDAKHKIEEPTEKAEEAKESQEPVYQVPTGKPVENGEESTYQVPGNNNPVQTETPDLLNLENELHTIEQRIEQIDTMEELFKELEAPPPASTQTASSTQDSWASSLAGISTQPAQSMFSVGGSPFPGSGSAFPPAQNQPFGAPAQNQPFGAPAQPMFGAPSQPQAFGFPQQQPNTGVRQPAASPFGAPFQAPSVPPRVGMGFQGQPATFPGTPFPGTHPQQPAFPSGPMGGPMGGPQPNVVVTPAADPFGIEPFGAGSAFEEGVLEPAKLEKPQEEPSAQPKQLDVFGDLVSIGGGTRAKSPKEMFVDAKPKKSLNEIKVQAPSPKPVSPTGFQASGTSGELEIGYSSPSNVPAASNPDPFGASNPFSSEDPFANDPFASSNNTSSKTDAWTPAPSSTARAPHNPSQAALFDGNPFGDDDFNLPVPSGPPPPLPSEISEQTPTVEPQLGPAIPPRPSATPPMNTHPFPPIPPRPKSNSCESVASSVSSTNSFSESQVTQKQEVPPVPPPRPRPNVTTVPIPRPRPRASIPKPGANTTRLSSDSLTKDTKHTRVVNSLSGNVTESTVHVQNSRVQDDTDRLSVTQKCSDASAVNAQRGISDSHVIKSRTNTDVNENIEHPSRDIRPVSSGSSISDPFVNTDPFSSDDPFTQSDPFANDPFASDPFSEPTYSVPQPSSANDPFTSVVASPTSSSADDSDPFSVFDKTFSSDMFKFDKSSSKMNKLKVSGQ